MSGQIGIKSAPGQGSTFWFTARFDKQAETADSTGADAARRRGQGGWHRGEFDPASARPALHAPRVLLAEDSPMNQQLALEMLRRLGYHADVVDNGYKALDALARRS